VKSKNDNAARPSDLVSIAPQRKHPTGLWYLAGTEFAERISFHGMQALLVLYMTSYLLLPPHAEDILGFAQYRNLIESVLGPLSVTALAVQTFGLYVGFVYSAPLLGGWIGDRLISRQAAIISGCLFIAAGQFALASNELFLIALGLLVAGAGLLRGNLSIQVKALYEDGDPREADAFQIYYVAINIGAFAAPLLTGTLAAIYGWHFGFIIAGVSVFLGLGFYLAGCRHFAPEKRLQRGARLPLESDEKSRLLALFIVCVPLAAAWVSQTQIWNAYNLWARDHVELNLYGLAVQVPWLQAFNGIVPIVALPLLVALWRFQARRGREPDPLSKLALGCLLTALGTLWLALAPLDESTDRSPLAWTLVFHVVMGLGWLYITPITVALFVAKSPVNYRGTMLGVANLVVFVGSVLGGWIGGFYETISPRDFWLLHAVIAAAGAVFLAVFSPALRQLLGGAASAGVATFPSMLQPDDISERPRPSP
jgi:POT family proton-dependent oligopeptide transporter